jgi:hypothetical protein
MFLQFTIATVVAAMYVGTYFCCVERAKLPMTGTGGQPIGFVVQRFRTCEDTLSAVFFPMSILDRRLIRPAYWSDENFNDPDIPSLYP